MDSRHVLLDGQQGCRDQVPAPHTGEPSPGSERSSVMASAVRSRWKLGVLVIRQQEIGIQIGFKEIRLI